MEGAIDGHQYKFYVVGAGSEGFKREDEDRLLKVLEEEGHASTFDFTLKRSDGLSHQMTVKVEPIERPAGFFIIRGYDHDTEAVLRVVS